MFIIIKQFVYYSVFLKYLTKCEKDLNQTLLVSY